MKKVLLMTDYSEAAEKAISFAIAMLKDTPCEFTLLNAYGNPVAFDDSSEKIEEQLQKNAKQRLNRLRNKIKASFNENFHFCKTEVMGVSPESAAFVLHERNKYDLIVVGATGLGNNVFVGSVATHIARNLQTNTLVVPAREPIHDIKKITLAVDYHEINSFTIFNLLKELTSRKNAEITLLTILKENQKPSDVDSFIKYQYHDYFKEVKTFDYFINDNDVEAGINRYFSTQKVDIFAVVTRHHSFYDVVLDRSISRKVSYHPAVPTFCIYDTSHDSFLLDSRSEEMVAF